MSRQRRSPDRNIGYMALMTEIVDTEPYSFEEEVEKPIWVDAMVEYYEFIMKDNVWEVVLRLTDKSIVGSRWIFKVRHIASRSIKKYTAIFVAKGFSQVEVIDYEETFSPIAR